MLRELKIRNFAIIDTLTMEFQPGLNILSGETGAGKSIVVGALGLVLGSRAQTDSIKTGKDEAEVQAFFDIQENPCLKELGVDTSEGIIVRRVLSRNGKGRVYLNDTLINVKTLENFGRFLVDIHGQHDHQSLLSLEKQLELIDRFCKLEKDREEYQELYQTLRQTERELEELKEKAKERAQRIDLLQYQIKEIESSHVTPGEMKDLEEERKILFNSTKLRDLCETAYLLIHESEHSAIDTINSIITQLQAISEFDHAAEEPLELLNSSVPLISDSASALRDMRDKYEADPQRLESVEKRLDTLKGLMKKYGDTEEEILEYLDNARTELDTLVLSDERIEDLTKKSADLIQEIAKKAHTLTEARKSAAQKVQKLVNEKLKELAFKKAKFVIESHQTTDNEGNLLLGPNGCDSLEFLFTANPSEPPKPLKKVASGGELSRVMLALKSVFADVDDIPIMVFDEIDAGIGGKTATSVGNALRELASRHQVLCITHLAQIASRAHAHFSIEKHQEANNVGIHVKLLEENDRIYEIARMLSGEITPTSIEHSRELIGV